MIDLSNGLAGIVGSIIKIINLLIPVLIGVAILFFMYGAIQYIYSEGASKRRNAMLWSLVALFVMVSVWGILRVACTSLTNSATCDATSYGGSPTAGPNIGGTPSTAPNTY